MSLIELNAHSYPRELAEQIWSLWDRADNAQTVLDSIETLHSFLSVAYQASLLREEGRPVECRIALSAPRDLDSASLARIGFHLVRLAKCRTFAEQEIRRLGPATGFYRSMILVEWSLRRGFEISGMIHTGALSRDLAAAVDSVNHPIPEWLIIHVRGPGNLVINRGSERLVTLLNGRVEGHGFDLFASTWLHERYRNIGAGFADDNSASSPDSVIVREDLVEKIGFGFMRRVIREIRNSRHGGTMVFVPRILTRKLLKPGGPLRAKYRIEETCTASPFAVILAEVRRRLVQFAVAKGKASVGWHEYLEWFDEFPFTFSQRFIELALWLSDLTAVDGCLLLDHEFTVMGFGVEIQVPSFEDEMVYRALDIEAQDCVLESMETAGTRHRTAYRLCREYSECLAVVVSQDGAVKFVANHQDKVTYWNHLDF
ncbi:MAG: DNA integrity scanning protein DisA nucleotide-binding domain protein [Verrucomicrobia bacterium]|nr:DNA integrity scanning protein DisA nucleotide-binding domain protein [Verrucomicrobiota bacterium]